MSAVTMASRRSCISLAALFVNVTARICEGRAMPCAKIQAMRVVNTRVLPEPAPAKIRACSAGSSTAARCMGFRLSTKLIKFCISDTDFTKEIQGKGAKCYRLFPACQPGRTTFPSKKPCRNAVYSFVHLSRAPF